MQIFIIINNYRQIYYKFHMINKFIMDIFIGILINFHLKYQQFIMVNHTQDVYYFLYITIKILTCIIILQKINYNTQMKC